MRNYAEQNNQEMLQVHEPKTDGEVLLSNPQNEGDLTSIDPLRSNVLLSKLPVHQLSKKDTNPIRLISRPEPGAQIDTYWKVFPNEEFGSPRQLAYRLDTLIVNRKIDEAKKPFPRIMRLGSLREIARELGIREGDTDTIKKALKQNSSAYISLKLPHPTDEGKYFEGHGVRYNLAVRGQILPNGSHAETVYILWNEPFYSILNTTRTRPLDYSYLSTLPPAAQRFYELASFQIFAALKYGHREAKIRYSDHCQQAPQTRYFSRQQVQNQMNGVHRHHVKSGYIAKVRWQRTTDEEGEADWFIHYTPGPRAETEFETFNGGKKSLKPKRRPAVAPNSLAGARISAGDESPDVELQSSTSEGREVADELLTALTDRGIFKSAAVKILTSLSDDGREKVRDYIDYWDQQKDVGSGLLLHLISENDPLPDSFETRRRRQEKLAAEEKREHLERIKNTLTEEYEKHRARAIDRFIAEELTTEEFERRVVSQKDDISKQSGGLWENQPMRPQLLDQIARHEVRADIAKEVSILKFEDFRQRELPKILMERGLEIPAELGIELPKESVPKPENLS